ncbi:assimilatory sulfite reductase (NADPH) hemoprotein subunit [Arhodomonas aquaeolei]|uniref:assimilatory sulfite reductase (NADPH) hemoprotein subunit n=1 Tax=Arhodomonas aquaeolei TaxID=2369 RepID=UPI000477B9AC|nr:assimilatory sulfite reductase (NADPH) hemoprotein subunit [Arhodomonas aquaeolei]
MNDISRPLEELSHNETLKADSDYLRGNLTAELADPVTGGVTEDSLQLTKFHGMYLQDDRALRSERRRQKLEPLYSFMVRVRLPGGVVTPAQWLKMDELARTYANGTLRLTTRQTFQFHGVLKRDIKQHIQGIDAAALDCIAACGDVNRNVIATANPRRSAVHRRTFELAHEISAHLLPRTRAYHEIFLGEERVAGGPEEQEPLYGSQYLPRKFKIALAVPPENDVDVFAHDIGFIAIVDDDGTLAGYNVTIGGGMGMTHGETATFPCVGGVIGFCTPDQVVEVAEKIMLVQRDHGDRANRKHARLKYTVDDHGADWFRGEVEKRLGYELEAARAYRFGDNTDRLGWYQGDDGDWHYGLFVQNGRVADFDDERRIMSGLRAIAGVHEGDIAITTNQNVVIAGVAEGQRERIQSLIDEYGLERHASALRAASMACVAFPTCGLAMAESERYLPTFVDKLEALMRDAGLDPEADPIVTRMTGCPNGCARPYIAEIGFVGKALGKYNLYLGGNRTGSRLAKLYRENIDEATILETLGGLLGDYARQRGDGECFGDFVVRTGVVPEVTAGRHFHDPLPAVE